MKYFIINLSFLISTVVNASNDYLGLFNNPKCIAYLAGLNSEHFSVEYYKTVHPDFVMSQSDPSLDSELTQRAKRLVFLRESADLAKRDGVRLSESEAEMALLNLAATMRAELAEYRYKVSHSLAMLPLDKEITKQPDSRLANAIRPLKKEFDKPVKALTVLNELFADDLRNWTAMELKQQAEKYSKDESVPAWIRHDLLDHLDFMKKYSVPMDLTFQYYVRIAGKLARS